MPAIVVRPPALLPLELSHATAFGQACGRLPCRAFPASQRPSALARQGRGVSFRWAIVRRCKNPCLLLGGVRSLAIARHELVVDIAIGKARPRHQMRSGLGYQPARVKPAFVGQPLQCLVDRGIHLRHGAELATHAHDVHWP